MTKPTRVKNLTFDTASGRYRYRNKLTGNRKWLGRDREEAMRKARAANKAIDEGDAKMRRARAEPDTVNSVISEYLAQEVAQKPWADSTRANKVAALRMYQEIFGRRIFQTVDRIFLGQWLAKYKKGDTYNEHRTNLIDVWAYAISIGKCDINEPAMTRIRSVSKKIPANRKDRLNLDLAGYKAIHEIAPPFLKFAMELSFITLQSRAEICRIKDSDLRDGSLFFVREKTAHETDLAFIRVPITDDLLNIRSRSRKSGPPCPYWINRVPDRQHAQSKNNRPHRFAVVPEYLTKSFQKHRDATGLYDHLEAKQRPTFHGIRGLGGRKYEEMGYSREYVQALFGHTDQKTSQIYLDDPNAIKDSHFKEAFAAMKLTDIFK